MIPRGTKDRELNLKTSFDRRPVESFQELQRKHAQSVLLGQWKCPASSTNLWTRLQGFNVSSCRASTMASGICGVCKLRHCDRRDRTGHNRLDNHPINRTPQLCVGNHDEIMMTLRLFVGLFS